MTILSIIKAILLGIATFLALQIVSPPRASADERFIFAGAAIVVGLLVAIVVALPN